MSKPIRQTSDSALLAETKKRLRLAERALSARQAARQIVYAAPAADTVLAASAWTDLVSTSIIVGIPCRLRLTSQVYFASTAAGQPQVVSAIFAGASGAVPAAVHGALIDLQGSTVATQPIQNGGQLLTWEVDVQPGKFVYTLSAFKGPSGAANAVKSVTHGGSTNDATWLQVTAV